MIKNIFKLIFTLVLAFVLSFSFACGEKDDEKNPTPDVPATPENPDDPVIKEYSIKFIVDNNTQEVLIKENEKLTKPVDPTKEGYKFVGWFVDSEYTSEFDFNIVIDKEYSLYAKFEKINNTHTVTYIDEDGNILATEIVEDGKAAKGYENTKEGYESFIDITLDNITEDTTVTVYFDKIVYKVTFVDEENKTLKKIDVFYGEAAQAPDYDNELYKVEYDKDFSVIKENLTVVCKYTKIYGSLKFFDNGKELKLGLSKYEIGKETELPVPSKPGHVFIGWFLSGISLTNYTKIDADSTIDYRFYARYVETERQDMIKLPEAKYHFGVINKNKHSTADFYVYQPQIPAGAPTGVTNYDWSTSDSKVATVSAYSTITIASNGFCILTAKHKTDSNVVINAIIQTTSDGIFVSSEEAANTIETVDVKFVGKNDEIIAETTCIKGGQVIYPVPISYEGYKFVGWDKPNFNILENTTIKATYELGENNYTGKSFAIIGDSISTYKEYIPNGFASFYPYATADVNNVNQTWWMQVINKLGSTLFVNNSYSGTCVADSSSHATKNLSRLNHCVIGGETPDVILVFMGANDCASQYVTETAFNQGYTLMLNNLKKICPDSEIILCTLPGTKYYSEAAQQSFNKIIIEHAEKFALKLVDCSSAYIGNNLVDSAHPDTAGMTIVAEKMIEELLK